jgi:transposase
MVGSRVELFEAIRRDHRLEGLGIRALADRHRVHRRTVRQALTSAVPPPRKPAVRVSPRLERFKPAIDAMLREDLDAPRKQRHTARRVLARLVEEHAATEVTYSTVRDYVARRRPQIAVEAGRLPEAFVPQTHEPGAEAEVDFADLWIDLAGVRTKVALFTLRLSYSGKAVHRAFATQGQEAFLEGHVHAFTVLGGLPERIRYDNLKAAVSRVTFGRTRVETSRWVAFRSHYGFDAFYCHPGVEGAHEKGGVEGEVGRFRRQHLVPVPRVDTLAELNTRIAGYDTADDRRRIANRTMAVGHDFAFERSLLAGLPGEAFDTALTLTPRVDRFARVRVRMNDYSVPARLIGRRVRVRLSASELVVLDGARVVARHARCPGKGGQLLVLDHYLEVLARKPGALPGATALAHARAAGTFTATHEAFWAAARARHGDSAGTRALVEVLLLHRHLPAEHVLAGITAALGAGSISPDVVAVQARKHAGRDRTGAPAPTRDNDAAATAAVLSLPARRRTHDRPDDWNPHQQLPADVRPLPTVEAYDQLLDIPGTPGEQPDVETGS